MTTLTYQPWALARNMQSEFGRLLDTLGVKSEDNTTVETGVWIPPIDIKEEPHRFILYADLPGVDILKDIEISMENDVLTIKGERQTIKQEEKAGFARLERATGKFYRRFTLPDTADAERISANSKNGVLEIAIPKREKAQPRKIQVIADHT
jgi:HSP20 family protein